MLFIAKIVSHVPFRQDLDYLSCNVCFIIYMYIQLTLIISNSKGLSEILRDIDTSTYQILKIEEKVIRTTTFNTYVCNWILEVRDISKILWKREEIAP